MAMALALAGPSALAGHGFMNAFADVEWLPEPGYVPGDWQYPLERLGERAELALAEAGAESLALALALAKEKLAEASTLVKTGRGAQASRALGYYEGYLEAAAAQVATDAGADEELRARYLAALLEHLYILSIDYLDMPLGTREVLLPAMDATFARYEAAAAALPRAAKEAQFFKEEEIRWSLEMARQADVQGITN